MVESCTWLHKVSVLFIWREISQVQQYIFLLRIEASLTHWKMNKDTLCSDGPLFSGTVDITPIVPIYWLVVIGSLLSCLFLTAPCTLYPGTANTHRKCTHKGYKKFLSINSQQFCIFEGSHFSWVHHCISNIPSNLLRYPEGGNFLPLVKITSVSTAIIPLAATSSISFIPFQLRSSLCWELQCWGDVLWVFCV